MYNLKDVMTMLNIPERTIRRHIKEGILMGSKIGGVWKFTEDEIENYIGKDKVQKYIKDEGLKDIIDYYRIYIEDKNEVIYMLVKQFNDNTKVKNFLKVTELFNSKFTMNCCNRGNYSCFTFKGQPDDVNILMKWSDEFDKRL